MTFLPEPPHRDESKTAILLVNLGTPDAPTASAVRRYLRQFLSDRRVVEIPPLLWWPVLHGLILPMRPRQSARRYARIWSADGSPLRVHTERQARLLRGYLGEQVRGPLAVAYAMRYGTPSIAAVMSDLKREGCERVLVLPLFPQYAASTTASVFDEVAACLQKTRNIPEVRMVKQFNEHPRYIAAVADCAREHWRANGRPDRLIMSFHGLPRRSIELGDPYRRQCERTARLVAGDLELADDQWQLAFQSRFGYAAWLKPYTAAVLAEAGKRRLRRLDILCPGFTGDCLETLEELGIEGKEAFLAAGGREFHLIPALNERDDWIRALASIAREHLGGWNPATAGT